MTQRRSRHPRRQGGLAGQRHRGERRHQGRRHRRGRRRRGDAAGARDARRQRHARAARRDRRARALPRSRLSAQGGLRERHGGCGVRRRHHRVRHAEHHPADRHRRRCSPPSTRWPPRRPMSISASMALLGEDTIAHVPELVEDGVIGFKLYMGNTFGEIPSPVDRRDAGGVRGCRADRQARLAACRDQLDHGAPRDADARSRPHRSARAPRLAARGGGDRGGEPRRDPLPNGPAARIHILHISSAEELRPLREAKARGVDITGETCPQYLLLSTDDYARFGGVIRVNPPVREKRNQEPLLAALADGTVDIIATDHAPHSVEEKTRNDIWTVDCGFPGVETQMPLMLTEVAAGRYQRLRLRALERGQPGEDLGALSAQGRDPGRRRCRHRGGRSRPRMDDRRRQAAVAARGSRRSTAAA